MYERMQMEDNVTKVEEDRENSVLGPKKFSSALQSYQKP